LDDEHTGQAEAAKEMKDIYLWIKDVRPNRPDPHVVSGLEEYYKDKEISEIFLNPHADPVVKARVMKMYEEERKIEQQYDDEDTEMLIRIIKQRSSMWT